MVELPYSLLLKGCTGQDSPTAGLGLGMNHWPLCCTEHMVGTRDSIDGEN